MKSEKIFSKTNINNIFSFKKEINHLSKMETKIDIKELNKKSFKINRQNSYYLKSYKNETKNIFDEFLLLEKEIEEKQKYINFINNIYKNKIEENQIEKLDEFKKINYKIQSLQKSYTSEKRNLNEMKGITQNQREEINNLRKERTFFDKILFNLEKDILKLQKELNIIYEEKNKKMKIKNKETNKYHNYIEKINNLNLNKREFIAENLNNSKKLLKPIKNLFYNWIKSPNKTKKKLLSLSSNRNNKFNKFKKSVNNKNLQKLNIKNNELFLGETERNLNTNENESVIKEEKIIEITKYFENINLYEYNRKEEIINYILSIMPNYKNNLAFYENDVNLSNQTQNLEINSNINLINEYKNKIKDLNKDIKNKKICYEKNNNLEIIKNKKNEIENKKLKLKKIKKTNKNLESKIMDSKKNIKIISEKLLINNSNYENIKKIINIINFYYNKNKKLKNKKIIKKKYDFDKISKLTENLKNIEFYSYKEKKIDINQIKKQILNNI